MHFTFNTVEGFGHLQNEDFIHNPIDFWPNPNEQAQALEMGLLPDEASERTPEPWFASRSIRINLEQYQPSTTVRRLKNKIVAEEYAMHASLFYAMRSIFDAYCTAKNFDKAFNLWEIANKNRSQKRVIIYRNKVEGNIIGFVVTRQIDEASSLSLQFAWDYADPKLSLGKVSQYYEVEFARQRNLNYIYLMPGYESGCLYKADFAGVEWFDGQQWRTDTDELKRLMLRDEQFQLKRPDHA